MPNSHRLLPAASPQSRRALFFGWAMYVISFGLPMMDDMWGYDGFWIYIEEMLDIDSLDLDALTIIAINASNLVMILSPLLLLKGLAPRTLGVLLILGGLHNTRFIWNIEPDDTMEAIKDLFPAYYVWWLSFFVTGFAIRKTQEVPV